MSERIPRVYAERRTEWDMYLGEYDGEGWYWIARYYDRNGNETFTRHGTWLAAVQRAGYMASNGPDGIPPPAE